LGNSKTEDRSTAELKNEVIIIIMNIKIGITVFAFMISGTMLFAQSNTQTNSKQTTKTVKVKDSVYYTCAMHPDVRLSKPGKCPICGNTCDKKTMKMTGTQTDKKVVTKTYSCSKHPEVKSDKPGKCPKCKKDMTLDKQKE